MTWCDDPNCPQRVEGGHEHLPPQEPRRGRGWLLLAFVFCFGAFLYAAYAVGHAVVGDYDTAIFAAIGGAALLVGAYLSLRNRE